METSILVYIYIIWNFFTHHLLPKLDQYTSINGEYILQYKEFEYEYQPVLGIFTHINTI